jgi:hypothetical protein
MAHGQRNMIVVLRIIIQTTIGIMCVLSAEDGTSVPQIIATVAAQKWTVSERAAEKNEL